MSDHDLRMTDEYAVICREGFVDLTAAEAFLGRELTNAESLALWDNYNDQVLEEMGR